MTLGYFIGLCLVAGIVVFLVKRAPFIDAEWKSYISYGILALVVLLVLSAVFGFNLPNVRIGR